MCALDILYFINLCALLHFCPGKVCLKLLFYLLQHVIVCLKQLFHLLKHVNVCFKSLFYLLLYGIVCLNRTSLPLSDPAGVSILPVIVNILFYGVLVVMNISTPINR